MTMTREYKLRRQAKHKAQKEAKAEKFPYVHAEDEMPVLKPVVPARQWQGLKQRPTRTGDYKGTPSKSSGTTVERSSDYFKQGTNNDAKVTP
jgi:hypothetical protein